MKYKEAELAWAKWERVTCYFCGGTINKCTIADELKLIGDHVCHYKCPPHKTITIDSSTPITLDDFHKGDIIVFDAAIYGVGDSINEGMAFEMPSLKKLLMGIYYEVLEVKKPFVTLLQDGDAFKHDEISVNIGKINKLRKIIVKSEDEELDFLIGCKEESNDKSI